MRPDLLFAHRSVVPPLAAGARRGGEDGVNASPSLRRILPVVPDRIGSHFQVFQHRHLVEDDPALRHVANASPDRRDRCASRRCPAPRSVIAPRGGVRYPSPSFSTVDFPAPFGPMMLTTSAGSTSSDTPCRTGLCRTPRRSRTAGNRAPISDVARVEPAQRPKYASITRSSARTSAGVPWASTAPSSSTRFRRTSHHDRHFVVGHHDRLALRRRPGSGRQPSSMIGFTPANGSSSITSAGPSSSAGRTPAAFAAHRRGCQRTRPAAGSTTSSNSRPATRAAASPGPTSRFSSTVICRKSRVSWNVRPIPSRLMRWDPVRVISVPRNRIFPASTRVTPVMALNSVDFPDPFGPITPVMVPARTPKLTPPSARTPPNRTDTPSTSRIATSPTPRLTSHVSWNFQLGTWISSQMYRLPRRHAQRWSKAISPPGRKITTSTTIMPPKVT